MKLKKNKKEKDYCLVKKLFVFPPLEPPVINWKKYILSFFFIFI